MRPFEECLNSLKQNIALMENDRFSLKTAGQFARLNKDYQDLLAINMHPNQFAQFVKNLSSRLKFYERMLVTLNTQRRSGSFFDGCSAGGNSHSFAQYVQHEVQILFKNFYEKSYPQKKVIDSESIGILLNVFSLKSLPDDIKIYLLQFFNLLNRSDIEPLKEKLLYLLHDHANTSVFEECLKFLVIEDWIEPKDFFQSIAENLGLVLTINYQCLQDKKDNILYRSIKYFDNNDQLEVLSTLLLEVVCNTEERCWEQKEMAMYGLYKIFRDYEFTPDYLLSAIRQLKDMLSHFFVNEYRVCRLIGAGGRSIHFLKLLKMLMDEVALDESNIHDIFKTIILSSKNESIIQVILSSRKLKGNLMEGDVELENYLEKVLEDPLTLQETKAAITTYLNLSLASSPRQPMEQELPSLHIEENLDLLVKISQLDQKEYEDKDHPNTAKQILQDIETYPLEYLSYCGFLIKMVDLKITEFNFSIAISLIRFIVVIVKKFEDVIKIPDFIQFILELTIRLPSVFLRNNTFQYICAINQRFNLVPDLNLVNYHLQLLDLNANPTASVNNTNDLILLAIKAEESGNFDLALRYYKKAKEINDGYCFYADLARVRIYLRKLMPFTALQVLNHGAFSFDLELKELTYELEKSLGYISNAIETVREIAEMLPFYRRSILSFQAENQLMKQHPLSEKIKGLEEKIIEEMSNEEVTQEQVVALYHTIQNDLTDLLIPRDTLFFCFTTFSPIESIESTEYSNEWQRILLDYLNFVFCEIASIDYHWKIAKTVSMVKTNHTLNPHLEKSEIHQVYSRVFSSECSVENMANFLSSNQIETLTVIEFVRQYASNSNLRGGYALGYSEDIAQTYDIYCALFGLVRWESAYYEHNLSYVNNSNTPEFLEAISNTNKPIVFFLPAGLSSSNPDDQYLGVTYRECQWLLEKIQSGYPTRQVILVLDAYDYLPYHLLTEIKYFYQHGIVFQFNAIKNRGFDEKIEIAHAAAQHFLTYVIDADQIESAQQILT